MVAWVKDESLPSPPDLTTRVGLLLIGFDASDFLTTITYKQLVDGAKFAIAGFLAINKKVPKLQGFRRLV